MLLLLMLQILSGSFNGLLLGYQEFFFCNYTSLLNTGLVLTLNLLFLLLFMFQMQLRQRLVYPVLILYTASIIQQLRLQEVLREAPSADPV